MSDKLIEEKYEELKRYVLSLARRWQVDEFKLDDVVQSVFTRLIEEGRAKPFSDARSLWARATNVSREEMAKIFAAGLAVSGVSFQAHWTATKALQRAQGDPARAYESQEGSSRVGRELMFIVKQGGAQVAPEKLSEYDASPINRIDSSLSVQDEDNIRVAISSLLPVEQQVLRLKVWEKKTHPQISTTLGISPSTVRKTYRNAIAKLKPLLSNSMERFM